MAINIKVCLDPQARQFAQQIPGKLKEARKNAVEAAGRVWADEAKVITQEDDHIDTSLYINSIGYLTTIPYTNKSGKGERVATEADVVHELTESTTSTKLETGSDVTYAAPLEARYNIMARALDRAEPRMQQVAETQVRLILE
ncbi:hypothetical protein ACIGHG_23530 [Bacillus sp. NPDC077411]|uniref:hypothetical protein n=1 Tax=Bacillus sp. NPDC077411 TaxID=3363947 RepID=UPI0037C5C983